MWSTSTMPDTSCSDPIGMWTATHCVDSWVRSCSSVRKKSARSRSSMFTNTTRARPSSSASLQPRDVPTSTPITAETVTSAPSTTRAAQRSSPWNAGSPGTSTRLTLRSCQLACSSDIAMENWRLCSSSSASDTVVPASTVPRRLIAPVWKSSASTSDVFPVPRWPTTATLRIFAGSGMGGQSSSGLDFPAGKLSRRRSPARRRPPEVRSVLRLGGLAGRAREVRFQPQDRLRVQLRYARLRDPENLADLAERQLLVVVERDDELLALGEVRDRLAERLLDLRLFERDLGAGPGLVLDGVDQGDRVASPGGRPQLVESGHRGARDLEEAVVELLPGHSELLRDLLVGRRAHELLLQRRDRALDLTRARAHGAGHPVERAELVDDRAADPRHREGLELDLPRRVEALDSADETEEAVRDEVLLVHVRGEAGADAAGNELHERRVGQDQAVAKLLVLRLPIVLPKGLNLVGCRHGKRIRRAQPDSSDAPAHEGSAGEIAHPDGEHRRRESNDPRIAAVERRIHGDHGEGDRQRREEEPEKAPLHGRKRSPVVTRPHACSRRSEE